MGACFFAEKGRGWKDKIVETNHYYGVNKPIPDEETLTEDIDRLYLVIVRYGDGGSFGRTDGYYDFPGVFLSYDEAYAFGKEHDKDFKKGHSGYFSSYDGWDVECVELKDENDVKKDSWW